MPSFVSIDVETANPNVASICQIGVAVFREGEVVDKWSTLIDPCDYFDPANVAVHGIDEITVIGAPKFIDIVGELSHIVSGSILVAHTGFDRTALSRAHSLCGADLFACTWLDSARLARRAWPEVSQRGYGLANLARMLGIAFSHHDALEDATAAGLVVVRAIRESGKPMDWWLERVERRIGSASEGKGDFRRYPPPLKMAGNPDGLLFGHVVVFTGQLSMPREHAAKLAADSGCTVDSGVTKRTTILVVGDQDIAKLSGKAKSSKHLKAEGLIAKGAELRIVGESDFFSTVTG